jgi:two-component system response regulator (stage 0 sporulation protein F)
LVKGALVVDDQQGIRDLLSMLLQEIGYQVYVAKNGLEAVEAIRRFRPQLVFMDGRMPGMNGLDALGRIKAIVPETEVIIMTSCLSDEIVSEALEKNARYCMAKPFEVEKVRAFLRKYFQEVQEVFSQYLEEICS